MNIIFDTTTLPPTKNDLSEVTDISAVRRWAKENNITVGKRGRLPATLINQYVKSTRSQS